MARSVCSVSLIRLKHAQTKIRNLTRVSSLYFQFSEYEMICKTYGIEDLLTTPFSEL